MTPYYSLSINPFILFILFLSLVPPFCSSQMTMSSYSSCSEYFIFMASQQHNITNCRRMRTLGAQFGWDVSRFNSQWTQIDVVFGARVPFDMGWLAWGINPLDPPRMQGTRAIIGIVQPNGCLMINTYNITEETKNKCRLLPGLLDDVEVMNMKADYCNKKEQYTMSAKVIVRDTKYNISRLNHVWQIGDKAEGNEPKMHPLRLTNFDSTETLNLMTGKSEGLALENRQHNLRMVHGLSNIVGWGTLLPIGVIIARYYKDYPFNCCKNHWYNLHKACQILGYLIGMAGWVNGLILGAASKYYRFQVHWMLAMIVFTFSTLQMLALWLKPKPKDEYRKYWNIYHHFLGYGLIAAITVNIFHGISILKPHNTIWKVGYITIMFFLGLIGLSFETYTWIKFLKNK